MRLAATSASRSDADAIKLRNSREYTSCTPPSTMSAHLCSIWLRSTPAHPSMTTVVTKPASAMCSAEKATHTSVARPHRYTCVTPLLRSFSRRPVSLYLPLSKTHEYESIPGSVPLCTMMSPSRTTRSLWHAAPQVFRTQWRGQSVCFIGDLPSGAVSVTSSNSSASLTLAASWLGCSGAGKSPARAHSQKEQCRSGCQSSEIAV
mmetsp:Transcript_33279/g.58322  ORF Transcript_33279/g.58322 Transcript_33279/m.58322 type:complete len:205 (-) Transcript_33279:115-729(-)